jgi:2-polyprenyl-3-methyl-5-hydroxy-6-metoxy-1,4-benzoquinol methylase
MTSQERREFLGSSKEYLEELRKATNFDQMLALWKKTSIPYSMDDADPYSEEYKNSVKVIYEGLTDSEYSASNELTSTKQSPEDFEVGYPWISGNLGIVAEEMAKPVQILNTLHHAGKSGASIIEFGCGWGNLALPLARARQDVSVVDIDQGFLDRVQRKAEKEGLAISSYCGDFVEVAKSLEKKFDVVIFQSSFHHCLDFLELLTAIKSNLLKADGFILFASEPISGDIGFPWGLRYDGESLWAIMCNKWLELGFDHDFFAEMLLNAGFFFERVPAIVGFVGEAFKANRSELSLDFGKWVLPSRFDQSFYPGDDGVPGRFCRAESVLPGLRDPAGRKYDLTFVNYGNQKLEVSAGEKRQRLVIKPGSTEILRVPATRDPVILRSQTFVPDQQCGNGDTRTLGANLKSVRLF